MCWLTAGQQIFDFGLHLFEQRLPCARHSGDFGFEMSEQLNQHPFPAGLVDKAVLGQNFDCSERDVGSLAVPLAILRSGLVVTPANIK